MQDEIAFITIFIIRVVQSLEGLLRWTSEDSKGL